MVTDPLQKREVFHLAFIQALARSVPPSKFVLKGGSNLRFFFGSIRYSEDMDLDASEIAVEALRDRVMAILRSSGLIDTLRTFGIDRIQPPTISRAKQTETVQRFKIHLLTVAGEDLFSKVEFSRRGLDSPIRSESISASILARYRMAPFVIPHYTAEAAARQKVRALVSRTQPQVRDVFDLYTLSAQREVSAIDFEQSIGHERLAEASERIYTLTYAQYRDTVAGFLSPEDRMAYDSSQVWDEIRLRVVSLLSRKVRNAK